MSHDHSHHHHHETDIKGLKAAFFLNFFFTLIEIGGGIYTNSLAILSDALHDFGDSLSLALAWYLEKLSVRKRTKHYTFGYKRFSLLGAFISSSVLLAGSIIIIIKAIPRLMHPEPLQSYGILILAVFGIVINGIAALLLRKGKKINQKIVMLHLLEDLFGWVAVLVGAVFIILFNAVIIDPILSIVISAVILWKTMRHFINTARIFLQSTPENIEIPVIEREIGSMENIIDTHDLHIWSLDGQSHVATIHLVTEPGLSTEKIADLKQKCREIMKQHEIDHVTIEIENESECCGLADC